MSKPEGNHSKADDNQLSNVLPETNEQIICTYDEVDKPDNNSIRV